MASGCVFPPHSQCSWYTFWIHLSTDWDKAVTEDERTNQDTIYAFFFFPPRDLFHCCAFLGKVSEYRFSHKVGNHDLKSNCVNFSEKVKHTNGKEKVLSRIRSVPNCR